MAKQKHAGRRLARRERRLNQSRQVIVKGEVSEDFLERMKRHGVTVIRVPDATTA